MTTWYVDLVGGTDTLPAKTITGATRANPCVITSASHGYQNGQIVVITSVGGMTQLNGNSYTVANVALNTYELSGVNSTGYGIYTSGGISTISGRIISNITKANPCVITCIGHGYSNDNYIFINDISGMQELNNKSFKVSNKTTDSFELSGIDSSGYSDWISGGTTQRAFLTVNAAQSSSSGGDEIRVGSTSPAIQYTSSNLTWTSNSNVVNTSSSLIGSISVGSYIGRPGSSGNGSFETYYRVNGITTTAITLESRYYGTTGTDIGSVYKIIPQITGAVNTVSISITKSILLSGGWNLTTSIQNGETWITTNAARTNNTHCINASFQCEISKMNVAESYRNFNITGENVKVSDCTSSGGWLAGVDVGGAGASISNLISVGSGGPSYPAINVVGDNMTFDNCIFIGLPTGRAASVSSTLSNSILANSGIGAAMGVNGVLIDSTFVDCSTGVTCTNNNKIEGCSFTRGTYGVNSSNSILISNCSFSNITTYGIYFNQSKGIVVSDCIFNSNYIDMYMDVYSGDVISIKNSHQNPSLYGYSRALGSGTYRIYNCSIDVSSLEKAISIISGASYQAPQYILQNSFDGKYGSYWANGQVVKDSSVFRTSGPSLKISYNTLVLYNFFDIKIVSCYAKSNQSKKFSLYMKRDTPVWTGTIVPRFKLDGMTLSTETTITSLQDSWTLYEWICPAGVITTDGELSVEFELNSNNVPIWVDDFTVTDL